MSRRTHTFRASGGVPAVALRLLLLSIITIGALVLNPVVLWQGVAVAAGLVAAILPRSMAAWAAAVCIPFGVLVAEPSPGRTALALLLVHAIHLLGSLTLVVPATSFIALRALLPSLRRFVGVQFVAQALAFGVWLLVPATTGPGAGWLAPVGAALVLGAVVFALRVASRSDAGGASVRGHS